MDDPAAGGVPADWARGETAAGDRAVAATRGVPVPAVESGQTSARLGGATILSARNQARGTVLADRLEVAASFGSRFAGLMGRPSLPSGHGLWLPGTGSIHMLFMRFPIDAVFLGPATADGVRRVVGLRARLRPWTGIGWARGARGVLELPAGTIAATGTSHGDEVTLELVPADPE